MANIMDSFLSASFLFIVIRVGVPLLYASMSAYVASIAGIPNIAVEGIMIFGAFIGVFFIRVMQESGLFEKEQGQILLILTMIVAALMGAVFSGIMLWFSEWQNSKKK